MPSTGGYIFFEKNIFFHFFYLCSYGDRIGGVFAGVCLYCGVVSEARRGAVGTL